jgi:hypothetical protein
MKMNGWRRLEVVAIVATLLVLWWIAYSIHVSDWEPVTDPTILQQLCKGDAACVTKGVWSYWTLVRDSFLEAFQWTAVSFLSIELWLLAFRWVRAGFRVLDKVIGQ